MSFRDIAIVAIEEIIERVSKNIERIRSKSPYREALSQDFARFLMRVAYPQEIPKIKNSLKVDKFESEI